MCGVTAIAATVLSAFIGSWHAKLTTNNKCIHLLYLFIIIDLCLLPDFPPKVLYRISNQKSYLGDRLSGAT